MTWNRLRNWLSNEYPELGDTLNYAILPQDLQELEAHFGFALPPAVRESYLVVDGQEPESTNGLPAGVIPDENTEVNVQLDVLNASLINAGMEPIDEQILRASQPNSVDDDSVVVLRSDGRDECTG